MTVSVLKIRFRKLPPRIISYRDFSNYHNANFINSLTEILFEGENTESFVKDPNCFYKVCIEVLNQHAPRKKKSAENKFSYSKQRNWCVSLLRKVKKKYFATLSEKDITDNKKFWQTIKLFLSEKTKSREKITLKTKTWFQMMQK